MCAKLMNAYGEESTELEKQIGCMAGMFQIFDRRSRLGAQRRITGSTRKSNRSVSGRAVSKCNNEKEAEYKPSSPQIILEYITKRNSSENCIASKDIETTELRNDFRGIVKESINKETYNLSIKTTIKEGTTNKRTTSIFRDSPRPALPADFARFSCDGREMSRTKSKIKEIPRFSLDSRESSLRSPSQRVPSVIAKLMGLDLLPSIDCPDRAKNLELENHVVKKVTTSSPIVIMKPKKREEIEGLSGLRKVRTSGKNFTCDNSRTPKTRRSPRPQMSVSPRAEQRKVELEKKPRTPTRHRQRDESISPRRENLAKSNRVRRKNELDLPLFQQGKQKKALRIVKETAIVPSEQPSPVSVLDASFYHDGSSPSPVKRTSTALKDTEMEKTIDSEIDSWKLGNIKNLVGKLKQLSSTDDDDYVSQILLATGIQEPKKLEHQLTLDAVQEVLAQKLESITHPRSDILTRARKYGGQFLLQEMCNEIKLLLSDRPMGSDEAMLTENLLPEWEDNGGEVESVVLEMERLIFKDLIDEVVVGECSVDFVGSVATRRRRKLFT